MGISKKIKNFLLRYGKIGWVTYRTLRLFKIGATCIIDGRFRSELYYRKIAGRKHHQVYTFTLNDRYPQLFSKCAKYLQNFQKNTTPKILSFGCSTGEEVFSLGNYMPSATIIGIDINLWCINQCRKKNRHKNYFFYTRNSKEFEDSKDYDAIFCMAVFQKSENRTAADNRVSTLYPFSKFESEILLLHQKLKPGGLFIIDEADFRFMDTTCASDYIPLPFEDNMALKKRPLFDRNNLKIAESQFNNRIFIKIK